MAPGFNLQTDRRALLIAQMLVILLMTPLVLAADRSGEEPSLGSVWQMVREGRVLPALVLAEEMHAEGRMRSADLAQIMTIVGDERRVEDLLQRPGAPTTGDVVVAGDGELSAEPALNAIVDLAKGRRIVILNESHFDQRHRAFALLLAKKLRGIGFTHFGAETFAPSIVESMQDGAPDGQSGVYVADPVFGDLVRQSYKAGYVLFSYEQTTEQATVAEGTEPDQRLAREETQAKNINAILQNDPDARMFIYAGGSHLLESPDASGQAWMALLLKRASGLDPLTIDQVSGTPHLSPARESPLYRKVKPMLPQYISVLRRGRDGFLGRDGVDLVAFHPPSTLQTPRPSWLFMCGYRLPYDIRVDGARSPRLIRAFLRDDPAGSIPVDQIVLKKGESSASLMLPHGLYRIEVQSEAGSDTELNASFNASSNAASRALRRYQDANPRCDETKS